jgi:hypothetical protein
MQIDFFLFLVNVCLKFIHALSTSKIKVIIYQSFNVKIFLKTIPLVNFKNIFDLFRTRNFFQFLYTTYYKFKIVHHDGLIMIEKILTLLSCIYV